MLILFRGRMTKPSGMSDSEFYGIWLTEARAALEAQKAGALKGIWKVAGKPIAIGIVEVPDPESFDKLLMQLPVYAKGYSFLVTEMDYEVLGSYEEWADEMTRHLHQAA